MIPIVATLAQERRVLLVIAGRTMGSGFMSLLKMMVGSEYGMGLSGLETGSTLWALTAFGLLPHDIYIHMVGSKDSEMLICKCQPECATFKPCNTIFD